jgi:hypothetical protein
MYKQKAQQWNQNDHQDHVGSGLINFADEVRRSSQSPLGQKKL